MLLHLKPWSLSKLSYTAIGEGVQLLNHQQANLARLFQAKTYQESLNLFSRVWRIMSDGASPHSAKRVDSIFGVTYIHNHEN